MKVGFKITAAAEPPRVASGLNGPWPTHDQRALKTAVRHYIKKRVQALLSGDEQFKELGIEVEVR